jgi:integrase/recombinase XerD
MFLEACELKGLSMKTIGSYEQTMRLFIKFSNEQGIVQTEKVTHMMVQNYISAN